jgi:hypothetical protein
MKKWRYNLSQLNNKRRKHKLTERDYFNRKTLKDYRGYIFRQDDERVRDLKYGGFLNVGQNGCGAVAVYNVMLAIGKRVDLCDVLLEFELNHIGRADGLLGTSPRRITSYFDAHGVDYTVINSFEEYKSRMNEFRISIIFMWESKSLVQHYFCIIKRGENDFVTINQHYLDTFGKLDRNFRFIKAYAF